MSIHSGSISIDGWLSIEIEKYTALQSRNKAVLELINISELKFSFFIFNLTIDLNDFKGAKVFTPVFALNEVESLICVDNGMDSNFGRFNINKEFPGDYQI